MLNGQTLLDYTNLLFPKEYEKNDNNWINNSKLRFFFYEYILKR